MSRINSQTQKIIITREATLDIGVTNVKGLLIKIMLIADEVREKLGSKILDWHQHSPRRIYIAVRKQDIKEVTAALFNELALRFSTATALDTPAGLEILYHFSSDKSGHIFSIRVLIEDKKDPRIDSLAPMFAGAEWIEREMWEMLGIDFVGHPNLKRLLLADEWPEGKFPLRKEIGL